MTREVIYVAPASATKQGRLLHSWTCCRGIAHMWPMSLHSELLRACVYLCVLQEGNDLGSDVKKVTIRGRADNVAKCKDAIKQMLEEAVAPQVTSMNTSPCLGQCSWPATVLSAPSGHLLAPHKRHRRSSISSTSLQWATAAD